MATRFPLLRDPSTQFDLAYLLFTGDTSKGFSVAA